MKRLLVILSVLMVFGGCSAKKESSLNKSQKEEKEKVTIREEIISRHPNGEKLIVAKYKGEGLNEKLILNGTFFSPFCEERESPPIEEMLYAHRGGH